LWLHLLLFFELSLLPLLFLLLALLLLLLLLLFEHALLVSTRGVALLLFQLLLLLFLLLPLLFLHLTQQLLPLPFLLLELLLLLSLLLLELLLGLLLLLLLGLLLFEHALLIPAGGIAWLLLRLGLSWLRWRWLLLRLGASGLFRFVGLLLFARLSRLIWLLPIRFLRLSGIGLLLLRDTLLVPARSVTPLFLSWLWLRASVSLTAADALRNGRLTDHLLNGSGGKSFAGGSLNRFHTWARVDGDSLFCAANAAIFLANIVHHGGFVDDDCVVDDDIVAPDRLMEMVNVHKDKEWRGQHCPARSARCPADVIRARAPRDPGG
jgi:hypothetical protein